MMGFTKEELKIVLLDMETYINRTTILSESPSHKALREKIEYMIENYCEHKNIETFYVDDITACKDCDEVLGWT